MRERWVAESVRERKEKRRTSRKRDVARRAGFITETLFPHLNFGRDSSLFITSSRTKGRVNRTTTSDRYPITMERVTVSLLMNSRNQKTKAYITRSPPSRLASRGNKRTEQFHQIYPRCSLLLEYSRGELYSDLHPLEPRASRKSPAHAEPRMSRLQACLVDDKPSLAV